MGYSKLEITVHCNLIHAPYEKQQQQKMYSFASWQIFNWTQFSCTNEAGEELSYLDVNTDEFWFLHNTFGPMNKSSKGEFSKQSYTLLDV